MKELVKKIDLFKINKTVFHFNPVNLHLINLLYLS